MATSSLVDAIQHYQRNIERSQNDETRLLHCITKLYKMPIKVEHLQETGIGKTVNLLRKYDGEIGVAAKALVTKWKAMVAAEEEPVDSNCHKDDEELPKPKSSSEDDDNFEKVCDYNQNSSIQLRQHQSVDNSSQSNVKSHRKHESNEKYHSKNSTTNENEYKKDISHRNISEKNVHRSHKDRRYSTDKSDRTHHSNSNKKSDEKRDRDKEKHKSSHENSKKDKKKESSSSTSTHHRSGDRRRHEEDTEKDRRDRKKESNSGDSSRHSRKEGYIEKSSHKEKQKHDKHKSSKTSPSHNNGISQNSTTKHSSSTNKNDNAKDTSKSERKRRHSDDDYPTDSKRQKINNVDASNSKNIKNKKLNYNIDENVDEDGIDSSTGVNFGDVLGMLNMPTKKSKKFSNPNKTNNSCSSSSKEKTIINSRDGLTVPNISSIKRPSPTSEKPNLLSSSAKLEPLDPSIALALPTISTHYKPMPLNQTVMDCVFNTNNSSVSKAQIRVLSDADALSHGISSKTMRTKIYSGVKSGQLFQVPSLFDLCIRVLQKNIDALEYTGGVPFEVLQPVLIRATPQQLLAFEDYNPYLMEDSDSLWQAHVQRNYRTAKREEMESWREMYLRCYDDQERKLSSLAQSIKQSQKIIAAPVRKTQLAFVDAMVKPPRHVQRKQEQYGTKSKVAATPAARVASLSNLTPNAAKPGDARLRVAATSRDTAQIAVAPLRPKKAPLMAKTLQFMRGRLKR